MRVFEDGFILSEVEYIMSRLLDDEYAPLKSYVTKDLIKEIADAYEEELVSEVYYGDSCYYEPEEYLSDKLDYLMEYYDIEEEK